MLISYYKNNNLKYASRSRYKSISRFSSSKLSQEIQKRIVLGDGAHISIKTSVNNVCDYVVINTLDTGTGTSSRWFVTSFVYLNGSQVMLFLQRDVIGEYGLDNVIGKIERGYVLNSNKLKFRKELSLNKVLVNRTEFSNPSNGYGNFNVYNISGAQCWGILYLSKPSGIDPNTGKPYDDVVNINIPKFAPDTDDLEYIPDGTRYKKSIDINSCFVTNSFAFLDRHDNGSDQTVVVGINGGNINGTDIGYNFTVSSRTTDGKVGYALKIWGVDLSQLSQSEEAQLWNKVLPFIQRAYRDSGCIRNNINFSLDDVPQGYDNAIVQNNNNYYQYSVSDVRVLTYGAFERDTFISYFINSVSGVTFDVVTSSGTVGVQIIGYTYENSETNSANKAVSVNYGTTYTEFAAKKLSAEEAGQIAINVSTTMVDEPYYILAVPLFNCSISGQGKSYSITKSNAFNVFNSVVQSLSGENGYLVDAQIYPYCPPLSGIGAEFNVEENNLPIPFFTISSNTWEINRIVTLSPNSDVKLDYCENELCIIPPDQSSKFIFNFYDYKNSTSPSLSFKLKTALKPFNIISCLVPVPEDGSLIGITYPSDLRGCSAAGNGFEVSLATNQYQQYLRNNSNYKQLFALDQSELQKQHDVEAINEKASIAVNTASATAMGAIGGASLAGGGWTGVAGAAAGGAAAGATVGAAMAFQYAANEELRAYEEMLQRQRFDLQIGTIKNLPNNVSRISSFNEIILKNFLYCIEKYECTSIEKTIAESYFSRYGYVLGVYGLFSDYTSGNGSFIRGDVINMIVEANLFIIAKKELAGGIYYYE